MNYTHQANSIDDQIRLLRRELKRSNEDYIAEYFRKNTSPAFPPAWKTLEVASFGTLPSPWLSFIPAPTRRQKLYSQLCYLAYIDQSLTPNNRFSAKLKQLLKKYPNSDLSAMGFPTNWQSELLWK